MHSLVHLIQLCTMHSNNILFIYHLEKDTGVSGDWEVGQKVAL